MQNSKVRRKYTDCQFTSLIYELLMSKGRFLPISIVAGLVILLFSCQATSVPQKKVNGISLVASRDSLKRKEIQPILAVNANAVALMPYAFLKTDGIPELFFNRKQQWYGERAEGTEQAISALHKQDLQVMIKPQLWMGHGDFTGDIHFDSEEKWQKFEKEYHDYILLYSQIAAKNNAEYMCLGTELFNFVKERPVFWRNLISEIRKIYSGKLVYAENWDKVNQIDIWKELDFIGVDAYFPISDKISPDEDDIAAGWKKHERLLENLSGKFKKQVLFTEYGYRGTDYALKEPWNSARNNAIPNHNLQARALKVLYEEIWDKNWFAGGFLWKWHQHENSGGLENDRFTPQNKPAENVVKEYYGKFRN